MVVSGGAKKAAVEKPGAVTDRGPSPDPDKEISTIRLLRGGGSWLRAPDADRDPGTRERKLIEKIREPLPGETRALAATTQPSVPGPPRCFDEEQQTTKVAAHAEVVEVASQSSRERCVLLPDPKVSMAVAPIGDGLDRPS